MFLRKVENLKSFDLATTLFVFLMINNETLHINKHREERLKYKCKKWHLKINH